MKKLAYTIDLVNGIFGGNSVVYWGVSAATGRLSNFHDICIKRLVYAETYARAAYAVAGSCHEPSFGDGREGGSEGG